MSEVKLYYSITEVSKMLGVNASLLRYWEKEFDCIRPTKNKRGTRSYTEKDIELLKRIQYLTKECGFTLEGTREQLKHRRVSDKNLEIVDALTEVRNFLVQLKNEL